MGIDFVNLLGILKKNKNYNLFYTYILERHVNRSTMTKHIWIGLFLLYIYSMKLTFFELYSRKVKNDFFLIFFVLLKFFGHSFYTFLQYIQKESVYK